LGNPLAQRIGVVSRVPIRPQNDNPKTCGKRGGIAVFQRKSMLRYCKPDALSCGTALFSVHVGE
jgi:hypothetical protein